MATKLTQFQAARLGRRSSSDIKNLVRSYQTQFAEVNDQYAKDFGAYQKSVAETMAPFEAAMAEYGSTIEPQYQAELAQYNTALEEYNRKLAEIEADPVIQTTASTTYRTWYGKKKTDTFDVFIPKELPTFDAKMPNLPGAPVAPEMAQFDSSKFTEQRKSLTEGMNREMSERSAARKNVVQRGRGRSLLQGA
jgi:uncharacterized phage infection (PIP) family protein YhgE